MYKRIWSPLQCRGRENNIMINDVNSFGTPVVLEGKVEGYCNSASVPVRCPFCASSQEEERSPLQCRGREEERAWDASDLFRYTP